MSSPFKRAVDSARPLAEILGLEIEVDPRLAERQLGLVEDNDWRAALRDSFDDHNLCLPKGESSRSAQARGVAELHDVFQGTRLPTAIFSHGNLLALIANSLDSSLGFDFFWYTCSKEIRGGVLKGRYPFPGRTREQGKR